MIPRPTRSSMVELGVCCCLFLLLNSSKNETFVAGTFFCLFQAVLIGYHIPQIASRKRITSLRRSEPCTTASPRSSRLLPSVVCFCVLGAKNAKELLAWGSQQKFVYPFLSLSFVDICRARAHAARNHTADH